MRLCFYIRVIPHHPQGTLHFYHIMHLVVSLRFLFERWSTNVAANTFHLNHEDSTFVTPEHLRQPTKFIDWPLDII